MRSVTRRCRKRDAMSSDGTSVQERVFQMKGDFAGQRDFQSGQRFLDGSAPRLRRHAASCEAADGDLLSSSAGKDQKPSWGVGQSPTVLASAARRLSSFNQIQTNRNKQFGRGKHCRLPILLKRSFTVLIASVGSARTAGRDERNVTSTRSARRQRRCVYTDFSP
jgi:hypothetical protein